MSRPFLPPQHARSRRALPVLFSAVFLAAAPVLFSALLLAAAPALATAPALAAAPASPAALALAAAPAPAGSPGIPAVDPALAERFARLALDCVGREYPNKIAHVMQSDADLAPPRQMTPAFYGCFDWHSAVHGHWLLARLARACPAAPFSAEARAALARSLSPERIAGEAAYLAGEGRATFERPYGLAWLLQLAAELREWDDPDAQRWALALAPLEREAARRLRSWLPKLRYPIRTGEHDQTAFALGLALDWARTAGDDTLAALIEAKARQFHGADRGASLAFEPSGQDFLSPCLGEADLMRRLLPPAEFAAWLAAFLPGIPAVPAIPAAPAGPAAGMPAESDAVLAAWLPVAEVTDRADGKLAHLDGLNLSRAWMLAGIAAGLPPADPRRPALLAAAAAHRAAGLAAVTGEHYEGGHWLGTFAVYLITERGLTSPGARPER